MQDDFASFIHEIESGLKDWENSVSEPWPALIPFDDHKLPAFPSETLPDAVKAFVEALAESTQTPLEMGGLLALGTMAAIMQKNYTLQVRQDWTETLNLYTVVVGAPAERKTPVLNRVVKPLRDYERERRDADTVYIARAESERRMLEGKKAAAEAAAVKGRGSEEDAMNLAAKLEEFTCPHELRLLVDDATQEKLAEMMEQQGGSITLCSTEGGVFDLMRGRYDKAVNLDVYLKAWDGEQIIVDRIGRRSNRIDCARLTTLLAIQPEVQYGLMDDRTMRGRGMAGRFLYAICRGKIGERKAAPAPVPETVEREYSLFMQNLLRSERGGILFLSPEAETRRCEFHNMVEHRMVKQWECIQEWAGKLVGTVCRIAAILHCGTAPEPLREHISADTFDAACKIGEFLGSHAEAAFGLMGASKLEQDAQYIAKRLRGMKSISRTELSTLCRGRFRRSSDMDSALEILQERYYIRFDLEDINYRGRSKRVFRINPSLSQYE